MFSDNYPLTLPHPDELIDSDDKPVDNELQILVPTLLYLMLNSLWKERQDWFFGVNMGVYHRTGKNSKVAIVPDGFLCLGVPRQKEPHGRASYIVWLENNVVPIFVLEFVSNTYGGEYEWEETNKNYSPKMRDYARLGVLYYAVYNPQYANRDKHDSFEMYRLENGTYQRQLGEPIWLPEIGLRIGRDIGLFQSWQREWLFWFDESGKRYLSPDEMILQERERAERLTQLLREKGIDFEELG